MALGITLITASVPLFMADLLLIPGNGTLGRLQRGEPVSAQALERLVESRRDSLSWHEKGQVWTDLGLAHRELANTLADEPRARHLEEAESALRRGLSMAPADPYAWMRLALVMLERVGPSEPVARALSAALATGRHERRLVRPALVTGLRVWDHLDEEDRRVIGGHLQRSWEANWRQTAEIVIRSGRVDLLLDAVPSALEALATFEPSAPEGGVTPAQ